MKIVDNITDQEFTAYLCSKQVDWGKTQNLISRNLFYNSRGELIAIDVYNDSGSRRKFTVLS